AALWDIRRSDAVLIDVTVPRTGRAQPGLRLHRPRSLPAGEGTIRGGVPGPRTGRAPPGLGPPRPRSLPAAEVTIRDGIPVTTLARTVLDLAAVLNDDEGLERALDQCEFQRLLDWSALDALAQAHPGHRGAKRLRRTLATYEPGTTRTKSDLEKLFLRICDSH